MDLGREPVVCGSTYRSPCEVDDCVCAKPPGHDGRHLCRCDQRWTDDQKLT